MAKGVLAVLMLLVLAGCGSSESGAAVTGVSTSDHDGYHGILLDEAYAVPDLTQRTIP